MGGEEAAMVRFPGQATRTTLEEADLTAAGGSTGAPEATCRNKGDTTSGFYLRVPTPVTSRVDL